jgi:hypothetical protein
MATGLYFQVRDRKVSPVAKVTVPEVPVMTAEKVPEEKSPAPKTEIKKIKTTSEVKTLAAFGFIKFEVPQEVKVSVDGTEVPRDFLLKWEVRPGTHKIQMSREGYEAINGEVHVKEGETSLVRVGAI